jgi:type IV pilus assembly protein PilP
VTCRFLLLSVSLLLVLGGCSGHDDLDAYIQEVKNRPAPPIEPIPAFEPPAIYLYASADLNARTPFVMNELIIDMATNDNGIFPDQDRPREELEQFSLDTLRMVGTLELGGVNYGLIKNREGTVYRVREGNYMGQSHGRITGIFLDRVELIEIVGDRMGGYVERNSSIALGEK